MIDSGNCDTVSSGGEAGARGTCDCTADRFSTGGCVLFKYLNSLLIFFQQR
jgi:hypothetical protein